MTLAHELGHLVLHSGVISTDIEGEAGEFAAEFLMPIATIRPQLRNIRLNRLTDLKREWGVSIQALIERAFRADLMTQNDRTRLYKQLSHHGWRTREPASDELAPELPQLSASIFEALRSRGLPDADIAYLAGFASVKENDLFQARNAPRLRAV